MRCHEDREEYTWLARPTARHMYGLITVIYRNGPPKLLYSVGSGNK